MKLRNIVLSTVLCILTLISSLTASAEFKVPDYPGLVPNDVYQTPYMPDQFTTVYAPWLKNFHLLSVWEKENGIYGGEACQQVRMLEISPVNNDIVYFGTDTSGLYKSINGGKSWFNVTGNANGHCTKALLCDPFDENTVYVGFRSGGFYRSKTGGRNWEMILADGDTYKIEARTNMFDADAAGNIYIASTSGLYRLNRKTDELEKLYACSGNRWWDIAVSPDGQNIYAACQQLSGNADYKDGIYTSHDAGKTWEIIITNETVTFSPLSIELHPENPNEVYAAGIWKEGSTVVNRGLFVSNDGGETYTYRNGHEYENLAEGVKASIKNISGLQFGPKNSDGVYPLYYAAQYATYPIRASYDYGYTFTDAIYKASDKIDEKTARQPENDGKTYTGYLYQAFDPDPKVPGRVLFGASGIYERSPEGVVTRCSSGFSGAAITDVVRDSKGKMILPAMDIRVMVPDSDVVYDRQGNYPTYRNIATEQKDYYVKACFDPKDDNHLIYFVGSSNGTPKVFGIRNSYDGGHTVTDIVEETKLEGSKRANPSVLQYDVEDSNTIYCSQYKSHDNGKTWTPYLHEDKEMFVRSISPTNPNKFVATYGPDTSKEIYVSEDRGETWKFLVNAGKVNDSNGYGFLSMKFDVADENKLWFTCARRYWGYIDLKTGEINKHDGLLGYSKLYQIAQNPNDPNHMLISSWPGIGDRTKDYKLAETRDGGQTWTAVPGFWGSTYHCIKFQPDSTEVFIGTMAGLMIYDYAKFHEYLDSKVTINVGGKEVSYSEMPVINNGRVLVPMRELFEQLGATVNYDDATRLITANKDGIYVSLTPGSDKATINGVEVTLDAAPYITQKGRTMVPLRFVAEALNVGVGWDSRGRTVYVK